MRKYLALFLFTLIVATSCKNGGKNKTKSEIMDEAANSEEGSFISDVEFLKKWDPNLIVLESGDSNVAISSKYQAKVFTSTTSGEQGKSLGWINYDAFGKTDAHMNAYGGENRFWLGPEGNAFSLFFAPGDKMVFENWKTPPPIDSERWKTVFKNDISVVMESDMRLRNYADTEIVLHAERTVTLFTGARIKDELGVDFGEANAVAYMTENVITNIGDFEWNKETGAPCIWILDMFPPSDRTTIFIPYRNNAEGTVATTDYFGEIAEERIKYGQGKLFFKADGKSRGKLGIPPHRALDRAGSYDAINKVLTITVFNTNPGATYLNQEWNLDADPYEGDVINAYNDGPLEDGSQMGPFYELESVSPAAFLAPQESLLHKHTVYHFTGEHEQLNHIVKNIFGITLTEITNAL